MNNECYDENNDIPSQFFIYVDSNDDNSNTDINDISNRIFEMVTWPILLLIS